MRFSRNIGSPREGNLGFKRCVPQGMIWLFLLGGLGLAGCATSGGKISTEATADLGEVDVSYEPIVRDYYITAEDVEWDYAPRGDQMGHGEHGLGEWGAQTVYEKTLYVGYTDDTFTERTEQPEHLGLLGPVIRGVVGDTIRIHFLNRASQPYSIHPIGTRYTKASEGAGYAGLNFPGSAVEPGESYVYTLELPEDVGPGPNDGSSILRVYRSHVQPVEDVYRGLVGPIVITRAEAAGPDGEPIDVDKEFICMFTVFDENDEGEEEEGDLMHSINGYIFGNQPGLVMNEGDRVRWYLFGMGSEVDLHTPHWHGNGVVENGHRKETIMLLPSVLSVTDMQANNPGTWMFKCNVGDHIHAGMMSLYTIEPK